MLVTELKRSYVFFLELTEIRNKKSSLEQGSHRLSCLTLASRGWGQGAIYSHSLATHRRGRWILIWCCISEKGADFVHRHRAHLLPAVDSHLQLMDPEVMGVSAGTTQKKTVSTTLQRKGKERQRVKSDLLHDDRKTQLAKPSGDCLMQGKWRGYINWVSHLKQNSKIRKPWPRVAFALLLYEPCKSVHQPRSFLHQPHPNLYKLVTSAKTISVG